MLSNTEILGFARRAEQLELCFSTYHPHKEIQSLLEKTVFKGGKRLRPLLTLVMSDLFQIEESLALILAKSIELVHAASLAHDDVIDQSFKRRGVPTLNALVDNKKAILGGDFLLADVIVQLSFLENKKIMREMAGVIKNLSQGEWLQKELGDFEKIPTWNLLFDVCLYKTSSVFTWCFLAPALLTDASEESLMNLRKMGHYLGLIFQLKDDMLDFEASSQKTLGLDQLNGTVSCFLLAISEELEIPLDSLEQKQKLLQHKHFREKIPKAKASLEKKVENFFQEYNTYYRLFLESLPFTPPLKSTNSLETLVQELRKRSF